MFEYKSADFFSNYFKNQPDFKLLEEFCKSKEKDEDHLYIGSVELLGTIYPLVLRVEIPVTFPHHKLTFRTKSLSGYPHLIHNGKIENGDWFCLNTPFAETAEEQLNQEVMRLKEWIKRQMRSDLPAIIKDAQAKKAIAFANAYDWENPDEINEFCSNALLTFVGDFHLDRNNFKEKCGFLHCIKTPDNRYYALRDKSLTNYELPYIIVDESPDSVEVLSDFLKLVELYEWDEKIRKHLLPTISCSTNWWHSSTGDSDDFDEEKALALLHNVKEELEKDEAYLHQVTWKRTFKDPFRHEKKLTKILPSQQPILLEVVNKKIEKVKKEHKYGSKFFDIKPYDEMTEEEREREAYEEWYIEQGQYEWKHFALGIELEDRILWMILFTNEAAGKYEELEFDIGVTTVGIKKLYSYPLNRLATQTISHEMFFGRGSYCSSLKSKKVALVGLGAIGSMVAETLAHCGVSKIGLWDNDIVEPGNICRSAYRLNDLGESKVYAVNRLIKSINPYIESKSIKPHGVWYHRNANDINYCEGSFYDDVNYRNQEDAINEIKDYDLIIDCTGSNEMLHFLSYAVPNVDLISMCITNHSSELLCITNRDGNVFELRKSYLSRIEQDTKNFYVEGSGCYSPTFLANKSDICTLVNMALRQINVEYNDGKLTHSTIFSYTDRGILADRIETYKLVGYDIILNIPKEVRLDAEEMDDTNNLCIGHVLGAYSADGKQVMITHVVDKENAHDLLTDAFNTSNGIIDYIGDYCYSAEKAGIYKEESLIELSWKASDKSINANNPLLITRNPDGTVSFFLYINNGLVPFVKKD